MSSSEYNQIPLEEGQNKTENVPTADEMAMIIRSTRGVLLLCWVQMAIGALLFSTQLIGLIISGIIVVGVVIGIIGAAKKNSCCLIAHFVFSLLLYIFSMLIVMGFIVYCNSCSWWYFFGGLLFIFVQAIGMRHSRILITLVRKYKGNLPRCCSTRRWCRANRRNQCQNSSVQTQTPAPVQTSIQTQTPSIQTQTPSIQNQTPTPMFFIPQPQDSNGAFPTQQFYPQPMFAPQGFVPMQMPMNIQGYPMQFYPQPMYAQMPPMVPSAPVSQENQPQIYSGGQKQNS